MSKDEIHELKLILEGITKDVSTITTLTTELKSDIKEVREDITALKTDVATLKEGHKNLRWMVYTALGLAASSGLAVAVKLLIA